MKTLVMEQVQASLNKRDKTLAEELNNEFTDTVFPVTIFVGLEVVFGFFGNVLVLYVFLFRYHVCNFRYFVLCLAFIDITSTLTTMPGEMVTHLYWYVYPYAEVCKVKSFFNMFTVCAEAFCLLTIAIDRYRKVCRPFGWQIKPKLAILICLVIYIISAILASPVPFLWGISYQNKLYKGVNVTTTICEKDGKYKETKRPIQYSITMEVVLSVIVVIIFVLYVLVARTLLRKKRNRRLSGKFSDVTTSSSNPVGSSSNVIKMNAVSGISEHSSSIYKKGKTEGISQSRGHKQFSTEAMSSKTEKASSSLNIWQTVPPAKYTDSDIPTDESRGPTSDDETDGARRRFRRPSEHRIQTRSLRSRKKTVKTRVRRKTLIMFLLTLIFMITTVLYLTLLSFIARSDDVLRSMSHSWRAIYFLFFRLYFINHVINPIVYGLLDPHFRMILRKMKNR